MSKNQFENIYKNNIEALQSFAIKLTRNKMDADDLVQETAIKAFRNFDSFRSTESFKNWSFTILKNTFITKYNKRKRENIISTPVEELQPSSSGLISMKSQISIEKKLKFINKCIENLSSKSKEPFKMYINGYSYKEISQYLQIPVGTVKSRINFARTKLKKYYQDSFNNRRRLSIVA